MGGWNGRSCKYSFFAPLIVPRAPRPPSPDTTDTTNSTTLTPTMAPQALSRAMETLLQSWRVKHDELNLTIMRLQEENEDLLKLLAHRGDYLPINEL
jgi:hypothetical protein